MECVHDISLSLLTLLITWQIHK